MAITATAVESAKRIAQLEAHRDKLEEERVGLKDDVLAAKAREELMKDKYWKAKGKLAKARDVFESERSKWTVETEEIWEKFWKSESEKAKLEIDLRAAWTRSEDQADYAVRCSANFDAENEGLKCLLVEKEFAIGALLGENATIEATLMRVKEENLELLHKMEALEKEKGDKSVEINELAERNAALEAVKEAMEGEHKKKVSEMSRIIDFLEREKREVDDKLVQSNRDNKEEFNRILCQKMAVEAAKRAMEGESVKVVSEQARRIETLVLGIRELEAAISQAKRENVEEIERVLKETADLKEKNLDLDLRADVLDREKQDLTKEIEIILSEKVALKEECDKKILKFVTSAHMLGREKREIEEKILALNTKHDRIEEMNKILKEKLEVGEKKIVELLRKIEALERERGNKDDEIHKLKKDKSVADDRIASTSNDLEVQSQEMGKARETIEGLVKRVTILEAEKEAEEYEKRAMEDEHKKKVFELTNSIEALEGEKRELASELIQATRDSREEIERISYEKMVVEAENRAMKAESEKEVLEHARRIEVLEWENRDKEAEVSQVRREKSEEIKSIFNKMEALKEEHEKKNVELVSRVDELEKEKKKLEDEVCQAKSADLKEKRDKTDEINRMLKEKEALEEKCDREISKLVSRVRILEREKRLALKESHDKTEEISKILNEKVTMKKQHDKKILEFLSRVDDMGSMTMGTEAKNANLKEKNSELFSRVGILEREKQELEVETTKKDEVIKVLKQQNESLKANKEIMEKEAYRRVVIKSEEDVESPQCMHTMTNSGLSVTPRGQNQGKKLVDVSARELQRRKLEVAGCSVTNQIGIKRYKSK